MLAKQAIPGLVGVGHIVDGQRPVAQLESRLHRVGQAGCIITPLPVGANDQPIHHRLDGVVFVGVKVEILL